MINWNEIYKDGTKYTEVSELLLDDIFANIGSQPLKTALDVGCGTGDLIRQLKNRGLDARGIDLSDYSADIVGDFLQSNLGKFDIIFANKVIAFNDTTKFLDQVRAHLREGGYFVCITSVTHTKYDKQYSPKLKNISVDNDTLLRELEHRFTEVKVLNKRYFESYGEEMTIIVS